MVRAWRGPPGRGNGVQVPSAAVQVPAGDPAGGTRTSAASPDSGPAAGPDTGPAAGPESGPAAGPESGPAAGPATGPPASPASGLPAGLAALVRMPPAGSPEGT